MRVAIFTDNDFDKVNGVTTTLKAVLRFSGDGVEPRIYTSADLGVETPEYFAAPSVSVGLPWYREMRVYWPRLRRIARELRLDGVRVVHVTTPGPMGVAARWLAARRRLPLVGSYHTHLGEYVEALSGSPRLGHATEGYIRWLYGKCEPVLVPSQATYDLLAARGYRTERLRLWSRGVDALQFTPARASATPRQRWRVDDRRPAILYAGRLSREKGLDIVPAISRWLDRRGVQHRLIFAGGGPMAAELRERCPDAVFLGAVSHDEMSIAMASADVLLFPSGTDSFGNVVLEAQASGLPVLVSDRGGPREQLQPDVTGFVCAFGDVDAFGSRLALLLRDAARRRSMGTAARRFALGRHWMAALVPLFDAWHAAADRTRTVETRLAPAASRRSLS